MKMYKWGCSVTIGYNYKYTDEYLNDMSEFVRKSFDKIHDTNQVIFFEIELPSKYALTRDNMQEIIDLAIEEVEKDKNKNYEILEYTLKRISGAYRIEE